MGDGFRSKDPTNSIKVLKDVCLQDASKISHWILVKLRVLVDIGPCWKLLNLSDSQVLRRAPHMDKVFGLKFDCGNLTAELTNSHHYTGSNDTNQGLRFFAPAVSFN